VTLSPTRPGRSLFLSPCLPNNATVVSRPWAAPSPAAGKRDAVFAPLTRAAAANEGRKELALKSDWFGEVLGFLLRSSLSLARSPNRPSPVLLDDLSQMLSQLRPQKGGIASGGSRAAHTSRLIEPLSRQPRARPRLQQAIVNRLNPHNGRHAKNVMGRGTARNLGRRPVESQ